MVGRLDKKQPGRRKRMNERDRRWFHTHRSGYESAWRIMHEERITTHVIFGICVGQRGPWGSERGQSSVTIRRAVPAVERAVCILRHWYSLTVRQPTPSRVCLPISTYRPECAFFFRHFLQKREFFHAVCSLV